MLLSIFFLRALLWQKILENKKHFIPYKEICFLWASSEIKRYIPGNIWSLLTRTMLFSEKKIDKKIVFIGLLTEAKYVILGSALLSIFSWSFALYLLSDNYGLLQLLLLICYCCFSILLCIALYKKFYTHATLLYIAFTAFFFFSLGTYFVVSSIAILSLYYFLTFISFFSLCYLLGYLAFITPMGLGVRETIMVLGLARFISLSLAGLGAIFARVMLVVSEIFFLFLVYLWYKTKNKIIEKLALFVQKNWHVILLTFCICLYCVYFILASFERYENFYTGRFDLGNMDQTVWNTFRGRIFQLTDPDGTKMISRLAFHADFVLILFAPLYRLWPDPRILLLIQTIILSMGAFFVYLLARKIIVHKNISLTLALLFLLNPGVQNANLYDFHAITLATTFLLAAFYFLQIKKFVAFLFFAILAGITKETVWITIGLFGLYIFSKNLLAKKNQLFGLGVFFVSLFIFYYLIWHAIPNARGTKHFALSYYSDFGDNPTSILRNMLFFPQKTIPILFQKERLEYLFAILLPFGFLPVLSSIFLLFAAPDLLFILLSNNGQLRQM